MSAFVAIATRTQPRVGVCSFLPPSAFQEERQAKTMPRKPLTPCRHPGCPNVSEGPYCLEHTKMHRQDRPSAYQRGYDSRWQRESKAYLVKHPLCAECQRHGRVSAATVVDHIKPHKGNKKLFWDRTNWQPLCKRCHDIKTSTEDGGFGHGYMYK